MNSLIKKINLSIGAVIAVAVALVVIGLVSLTNITTANGENSKVDGRLVTIHDAGKESTVLTQALTIGDAIRQAGIVVGDNDIVEPALDEQLISNTYQVNIYRARLVTIIDGNIRQKIMTAYQTPSQIAEAAGLVIYPEDGVKLTFTNDFVEGVGLQMVIERATPIDLTLYGKQTTIRTLAKNVKDFLSEKAIVLSQDDKISVDADAAITKDMSIRIWREGKQTLTIDEMIDFESEIIENADLDVGSREIKVTGSAGAKTVIYEIITEDGQAIGRTEIASVITKQPITQIEVIGVKGKYNTPSENETIAWNFLIGNGFSRIQTAGIMGNLMQEHRFNTSDVSGGLGIVQWTGGRRDRLIAMYPDSYTNIYSQLNYLMYELNGSYAYVRDAILASQSLSESVLIFQNQFERCGVCMESNRIAYAQTILGSH